MKMKFQIIVYLFVFLFIRRVNAQDTTIFAPIGTTWFYTTSEQNKLLTFNSIGDTIINGNNARIIDCFITQNGNLQKIDSLTKYVFTIGTKVYYMVSNSFVLLYDFGAEVGDTIKSNTEGFPIFMGCESNFSGIIDFSYIVISTDSIYIDGVKLRTQIVKVIDSDSFPEWILASPIVERIGQLDFGGTWWGHGSGCLLEDLGLLRCYVDNDIYFRNPYYDSSFACDYTEVATITFEVNCNIYPNPVENYLYIPEDVRKYYMVNILGEKMAVINENSILNLSNIPPGVYFIYLETTGNKCVNRIVKR